MHLTTLLRLEWLIKKYFSDNAIDCLRPLRLLDLGRNDADDNTKRNILESKFERVRLPASKKDNHANDTVANMDRIAQINDEEFDVVLSTHALEHVARPWKVFSEVARVLKPGGIFLAIEPGLGERNPYFKETLPAFNAHQYLPDFYRFSADALSVLAEDAGLRVLHTSMNKGLDAGSSVWFELSETILVASKGGEKPEHQDAGLGLTRWEQARSAANNDFRGESDILPWFRGRKNTRKKGVVHVIGNCQGIAVYQYLTVSMSDYLVSFIPWSSPARLANKSDSRFFPYVYEKGMTTPDLPSGADDCDILFITDLPELASLRGHGLTIRIPFVYFQGFHPDFTWRGPYCSRTMGSAIVAECYLRGYSEEKALSMFTAASYKRLGYYSAFDSGIAILKEKFSAIDLDLRHFLPVWMRKGLFMCDPYHPEDFVIQNLVETLCSQHGIALPPCRPYSYLTYNFSNRLPVFPELAEYLNIPEYGSYRFRRTFPAFPPWEWEDSVELDEYIFLAYQDHKANSGDLAAFPRLDKL